MSALQTTATKPSLAATRTNGVARSSMLRKLNRLLAAFGRAMHSSHLVHTK
ncbi:MAG: hypothetical protein AB1780_04770 [Pseudomonadota bacterium]